MYVLAKNDAIVSYPYGLGSLRRDNPHISFPSSMPNERLAEFDVFRVAQVPKPSTDYTQVVIEGQPMNVGGAWTQVWIVRDATDAEEAAAFSQLQATYEQAVQQHLDTTAQSRGYDNMMSACSYAAGSHPKFSVEGRDCIAWRSAVWEKSYEILTAVKNKTRPLPTIEEVIAELPPMVWSI